MSKLTPQEQSAWTDYIYSICGVSLDASKGYLIETRLGSLVRELGLGDLSELFYKVKADTTNTLRQKIIDAITTNETSFFRDTSPFELLQFKILPDLIDKRNKTALPGRPLPIRIWSAACSTGQEVYSTCFVIKELLGDLAKYDVRILGTDISDRAIALASHAFYTRMDLDRGLTPEKLNKHFVQEGAKWKVRDELRAITSFKRLNLFDPLSLPCKYDIIFCRNVAIYFTEPDKIKLFRNIARFLAPDGYLIIGSTESITGLCPEFEAKRYLRSIFYQFKQPG